MLGGLYIGQNAAGTFAFLNAANQLCGPGSFIVDPALLPAAGRCNFRFGGALTGAMTITFKVYTGGTKGVVDGSLIYTSPAITAPQTPLILEAGLLHIGPALTRLKFVYTASGVGTLDNWFWEFYLVPPSLPARPKVVRRQEDLGFGTDIDVISDLPASFVLADGPRNLANAIARRLDTPAGALIGIGDDADYGFDIRSRLNADLTMVELQALIGQVERECLKDERVQAAAVAPSYSFAAYALALDITLTTAAGPYRLVLGIGTASVDVLDAST
jgi:hypothetical protein